MEAKMSKNNYKAVQMTKNEKEWRLFEILKGNVIAYMITAIIFIAAALLLTYTGLPETSISLIAILTTIISAFIAGYDAAKGAKARGWFWGMSSGMVYAILLILIGSLVGKSLALTSRTITLLIIAIGSGALGGMIGINVKK